MAKKEYIEREALIAQFECNIAHAVYGKSTVEAILSRINIMPTADVVERSLYDQIKWERDMVMSQLEEVGILFGGKTDVAVVRHGAWILDEEESYNHVEPIFRCSACKAFLAWGTPEKYSYCPHCGARMDGGDTNESIHL